VEETHYREVKSEKLNHNEALNHDPKASGATKEAAKSKVLEHKQAGDHARLKLESQVNGQSGSPPNEADHRSLRPTPRGGSYLPDIKDKSETVWVNGRPVSPPNEADHEHGVNLMSEKKDTVRKNDDNM
jgi:hypothetical protein